MDWHKRVYKRRIPNYLSRDSWHKLRMECLKRDKFTCQRCEKTNSQGRGITAHHMIPRAEDGADDISNLLTLCHPCHDYVEINNLRTLTNIIGSYEDAPIEFKEEKTTLATEEGYHFVRPEWHQYVYGGAKRA